MKYRVTMPGFIGYRVKPGQIIELSGPPTIDGLVPVEDAAPEPAAEEVKILRNTRKPRDQVAAAAPEPDDDAPVI